MNDPVQAALDYVEADRTTPGIPMEAMMKMSQHRSGMETADQCAARILAAEVRRVMEWASLSDDALRLRCGEMSAQEIRTVRAVLNSMK